MEQEKEEKPEPKKIPKWEDVSVEAILKGAVLAIYLNPKLPKRPEEKEQP